MPSLTDDLGYLIQLRTPPQRVISLVPSLTEALAVTVPDRLVGATDWCTHPTDLAVPRVRGTKNPDRAAIHALAPDLVVANQEENRQLDVQRLRAAGITVWVTAIESVSDAMRSLRRLFVDVLAVPEPGWLSSAATEWSRPRQLPAARLVVPIWRDPWMVVGSRTFCGDLISQLGLVNVFSSDPRRYPTVELSEIHAAAPDLVLLPDEPYLFTASDGPEAFPQVPVVLVPGRAVTWYGPSLVSAASDLTRRIESVLR
jgi:ABC-type Fe3+-hydroxamate transport system substrate-binding protein